MMGVGPRLLTISSLKAFGPDTPIRTSAPTQILVREVS